MIDFTSKQLSWIVISACGIGGGGYLTMNEKVTEIDKKVAVVNKQLEESEKQMSRIENAILRIEEKTYKSK